MQVSIDKIDELKRKITVTVPAEEVEKDVVKKLRHLQKTVRLPGFRPGKVPSKIVESKYGSDVLYEVTGDIINRSYFKALVDENIEPATQPNIAPEKVERGNDLTFTAEFEVYPEVKSTDLSGITIEKPICVITEKDIDDTVNKIREQRVTWNNVERAAKDGDQITIDFKGTVDGEPFEGGSAENFEVVLGRGGFIADFEEGLKGVKPNDEKSIDVGFPDDYPSPNLVSMKAKFDVIVRQVAEPILPELDEEFIKTLGLAEPTLEAFRTQVKENMQRELDNRINSTVKRNVLDALYEKNDLTISAAMIEQEKKGIVERHKQRLAQQGLSEQQVPLNDDEIVKEANRHAVLSIVAKEVIKKHNLKIDANKVDEQLISMAASYEDPASFVQWYKSDNNRMVQIESAVLEQQMVDKLIESATVNENNVEFSDFVK